MDNSTFNILKHQFYINENDRNKLYILTVSKNIKFSKYLESIIMGLEIVKFIEDMKSQLLELAPDITKKHMQLLIFFIDNL